ncbi:HU family DNA-binding protein [Streptomyces sp. NPDC058947]|uniref:HU family DNA-binding protein n=1 Tax=Streptomyces sp. NPDC058947 TaxID=3346675 RepID=UPI0036CA92BE
MPETTTVSLNKVKLADMLAERMGLARTVAYEAVENVFDIMAATVAMGGSVSITNCFSMERVEKKGRRARNPHTGEPIDVPPRKAVKFNASPRLLEFANSSDPSRTTIKKLPKGPVNK